MRKRRIVNVLHVPYTWFPDEAGGTEYYVRDLCDELARIGVRNVVAAPGAVESETDGNPRVWRFPVPYLGPEAFREELYGEGSAPAASALGAILDEVRPDVVHLHSYTRGCSLGTLKEVKRRRLPVVFTYHTPTVTCPRGTLLRWGAEVCDGRLDAGRCGACVLESCGVPRAFACVGAWAASVLGDGVGSYAPVAIRGALRLPSDLKSRNRAVLQFLHGADKLIAPSLWVRTLLEELGIDRGVISHVPQGLSAMERKRKSDQRPVGGRLSLVVAGRASIEKGLDLVPAALGLIPSAAIHVTIFVAVQGIKDERRFEALQGAARRDPRLSVVRSAPRAEVFEAMSMADAVIVPSRWLETGPLVVLEAFAAGVPVVGARLGGIVERVEEGVDGLLFEAGNPAALAGALARLVGDRSLLAELRRGVTSPPSMADVASTMRSVYEDLHRGG